MLAEALKWKLWKQPYSFPRLQWLPWNATSNQSARRSNVFHAVTLHALERFPPAAGSFVGRSGLLLCLSVVVKQSN